MSLSPWELCIFARSSQTTGAFKLEGLVVNWVFLFLSVIPLLNQTEHNYIQGTGNMAESRNRLSFYFKGFRVQCEI